MSGRPRHHHPAGEALFRVSHKGKGIDDADTIEVARDEPADVPTAADRDALNRVDDFPAPPPAASRLPRTATARKP